MPFEKFLTPNKISGAKCDGQRPRDRKSSFSTVEGLNGDRQPVDLNGPPFMPYVNFQFGSHELLQKPSIIKYGALNDCMDKGRPNLNDIMTLCASFIQSDDSRGDEINESSENLSKIVEAKYGSSSDAVKSKGRKRKQRSNWSNIKELIENEAIPKWVEYLKKKMKSKEDKESHAVPREDTIWKKIFRDCREFYRILFKLRFHPLDYRSCEQADACSKILLSELGIDTSHLKPYDLRKVFYYFHQTRLNSSDHYGSDYIEKEGEMYAVDIIEKYKDSLKTLFMIDPVCSRLFYLLYFNFDYVYFCFLKPKYKGIIDLIIENVLKCYDKMAYKKDLTGLVEHIF